MILATARPVPRPFATSDVAAYAAIRVQLELAAMLPEGSKAAARAPADAARLVPAWAGARPGDAPLVEEAGKTGRLLGHLGLRSLPELGAERIPSTCWTASFGAEASPPKAVQRRRRPSPHSGSRLVIALARPENAALLAMIRELGMLFKGEVQALGAQGGRYAAHALTLLAGGGPGGVGACTTC